MRCSRFHFNINQLKVNNMIHELLLALSGYPGTIFTWNKRTGLQVSQDLPFLHPSETSVLNRLSKLGSDYIRFTEFIEQHTGHVHQQEHHTNQPNQTGLHGFYLRAFCTGLDSILQPYRQALLDLEQEFLGDPHLTISHVNYKLDQFQLLFPSVMVVVESIRSQKIHGCQILETVYKHSCGGLPPVRMALEKILAVCHGVMYKQLAAWMLHGLLLDQSEEFFVKQGPSAGGAAANQEEEEEDLGLGGLSGKQLRELQDLRLVEEENMLAPSLQQFSLRTEMLPSYIPIRVAEKILFVGESVQMFENHNHSPSRAGSILKHQEDLFAAELHRLKQQPLFSLVDFENVIDRIRGTVAEHLWTLMVEESDLLEQLKIIKDFYLLGRGELYQVFIDLAQHMLKTPPTAVTEHDVNVAFQQAAHKVLLDDDNLLPLLHLTVDYQGKDSKEATGPRDGATPPQDTSPREVPPTGWAALGLTYKVQWPLHILFTPAILEKYNVVFRYLLSVRRVQSQLQHCWALQMQRKHLKSSQTVAVKWRLRNHMAFLIDNLQYYLQVDVLESQFSQLLQLINSTRDFESIRLAHDHFLSNLLAQSFILLKPVFHCLNEILELCQTFCSLVGQSVASLDERATAQLDILVKGFRRQSSLLFKILSSVRNHQINSDLAQLLLRLDYNKYYTQAGGTLGSV
ncbi:gamma-tubulin complex component 4 [Cottoperca gobio]|uniref:Gamma-tubulin complex component n=1 Tax=Cottoperca gobio TaxID=56716 RepID=A0A6J2RLR5_COTGO|nr:gamma-tubulin complex component 4 [Cottoperca gobio]